MDNTPNTIGLEFESVVASREDVTREMNKLCKHVPIKSVTRDASVESNVAKIGDGSFIFLGNTALMNKMSKHPKLVTGYEIVTHPMEINEMRKAIQKIVNMQARMGELFSGRSSTHVHLGFPRGFIFLKSAVSLGLKVEPLFYKIAGMGNKFRGLENSSAYCRPLALPPVVRLNDTSLLAVLDPKAAVDAEDERQFWGKFGILQGDTERYNPLRYMGVNVFSSVLRGTIEFRFFNFCNVSKHVEAITGLSQFIADLMIRLPMKDSRDLFQIDIFKENSNHDYHDLLRELVSMGDYYNSELPMSNRDMDGISELIESTPQPVFVKKPILSHIQNGRIGIDHAKDFGLQIIEKADPPGIVDIHNFNAKNRRLLECVN